MPEVSCLGAGVDCVAEGAYLGDGLLVYLVRITVIIWQCRVLILTGTPADDSCAALVLLPTWMCAFLAGCLLLDAARLLQAADMCGESG